jgi:hypothetical protein
VGKNKKKKRRLAKLFSREHSNGVQATPISDESVSVLPVVEEAAATAFDYSKANDAQKEAIEATEGPVLIIAGPGTGKTYTLVQRALNLIVNKGVKPEEIMLATFTEKAAKELVTRISNELSALNIPVNLTEMYIGTFHSICLRIIKENLEFTRIKKNFKTLDDLKGKKIGVQKGTTGYLMISEAIANGVLKDTGAEVIEYANGPLAMAAMKNGRCDVVVIDELPANKLVK